MAADPFPRDRVAPMLRRLPAYLRLSWRLTREPLLGRVRRAAVIGAAGYLASPIDLALGVVPVLGQLDDVAVALAAIRLALAGLSPERRRFHLDAVGLADEDLTADLWTVAATTAWAIRSGVRVTARSVRVTGRAVQVGGRAAVQGAALAARGSRAVATKSAGAGSAARSAAGGAARSASTAGSAARSAAGGAARSASTVGMERLARLRARSSSGGRLPDERDEDAPPSAT